ncbi:MAG TPA: hypothetical protein ENK83_05730 [Aliiroseovarius sp.]|nr:hypothetical protein [Aliiroseovarius sp.]
MKFAKRTFIAATLALTLTPLAALAQGGNDPMPGIDIIIKEDPGSRPIHTESLTGGEIEKFNSLKGKARAEFLARIATRHVLDDGPKASPEEVQAMLIEAMGDSWCGPCRMVDGAISYRIALRGEGLAAELRGAK